MQYFGGKGRSYKAIVETMTRLSPGLTSYTEPFLGAGWVGSAIDYPNKKLSDANPALVSMWQALCAGWVPPGAVSEEEYRLAKALPDSDPLKAFIGFACSFAGKWFGGYARNAGGSNYAAMGARSLLRKLPGLIGSNITHADYRDLRPCNDLVYCDPPYAGTTGYAAVGAFDSAEFWSVMRTWARDNDVYVSEYAAPDGVECVWSKAVTTDIRGANGRIPRVERLFRVRP